MGSLPVRLESSPARPLGEWAFVGYNQVSPSLWREALRVLILDDDRAHGESLTDLLNSRGHEAYFAASFDDACWLLELFRFGLAILDHDMPDVTGLQAAREIIARDPEVRTAVMSAREIGREVSDAPGSVSFLAKPISVETLLALIGRLESGKSIALRLSFPLQRYPRRL